MSKNINQKIQANSRPRIGITMRLTNERNDFYLRRNYSEAIAELGGIPLHLPLIPKPEFLSSVAAELDGILLPGSDSDLDPLRYGSEPHNSLGEVQPLRDETDLLLIKAAEKREMPLLAICYGMQALNVARGGSLIQDLKSEMPCALAHQQKGVRERLSHHILIESNSLMARLSGAEKALVNSHHHQSILDVGQNLRVTARALDNVIEAVEETRGGRFVVGVQWHPELNWENDKFAKEIFCSFVTAAGQFRQREQTKVKY